MANFYVLNVSTFDLWVNSTREEIEGEIVAALLYLAQAAANAGDNRQAHADLDRLLTITPWHEEAHRLKMLLLAHQALYGEAIGQYQLCRAQLAKELGSAPDAEIETLLQRIKAGEIEIISGASTHSTSSVHIDEAAVDRREDAPSERVHIQEAIAQDGVATARPAKYYQAPVPLMPLLGRAELLQSGKRYLLRKDCRLLTLLGIGGVGKSHLALTLAQQVAGDYAHGVCRVSLAEVKPESVVVQTEATCENATAPDDEPNQVTGQIAAQVAKAASRALAEAIANALGLTQSTGQSLTDCVFCYLQMHRVLLILDNLNI